MARKLIKNAVPFVVAIFIVATIVAYVLSLYTSGFIAYVVFSAFIGRTFLELAWNRAVRYRDLNEERDKHFPAFRRLDAHMWKKAMFYPMCLTIFTTRMIISLGSLAILSGSLKLVNLTHKRGQPHTGVRAKLNSGLYWFWMGLIIKTSFMRVETKYIDFDYSEYLGADYKQTQQLPPKASTIVANHQCWLDSLILICTPLFPGFAAKVETKKVWVLASLIDALQSLYISRGGTDEERQ